MDSGERQLPDDEERLDLGKDGTANITTRSKDTGDDHSGDDDKKSGGAVWLNYGEAIWGSSGDDRARIT